MIESRKKRDHADNSGPKAFVVDDDKEACAELAEFLRDEGLVVEEYHDGLHAVRDLRKHKPEVVFMDIRMPLMDGIQATEHVLSQRPGTTVVLMSAYPAEVVRGMHEMESDLAALTVVQKPIHLQELAAIISGVLKRTASGAAASRAR